MEFVRATNLGNALDVLEQRPHLKILAGGTDVMIQLQRSQFECDGLLHIEPLRSELGAIVQNGEGVRIGALATHRDVAENAIIREMFPALAQSAATVGGWQTQLAGTIVGNICNASPAADTAPPLLIYDAQFVLQSKKDGERRLPMAEFFIGRREIARRADELVTHIELANPSKRAASVYLKVGRRRAMEVAIAGLAVQLIADEGDGAIESAAIATCSLGPAPRRVADAEASLIGQPLRDPDVAGAIGALKDSASPIDDARSSAAYRRAVLAGLLERAVAQCCEQIIQRAGE